jgi:DNA-binding NarL/FixJ family response regulator
MMPLSVNAPPAPLRVLVGEASDLVREGLHQLLAELAGVKVVGEAATAAQLETLVRTMEPDLILIDLGLPGPDLFAAISSYAALRPEVRLIALSELCSPAIDRRCLEAGADVVLSKTMGLEQLAQAIVSFARTARLGKRASLGSQP